MPTDNMSNRGSATDNNQREHASRGGQGRSHENNSSNFAHDREKAQRAGHEGGSK